MRLVVVVHAKDHHENAKVQAQKEKLVHEVLGEEPVHVRDHVVEGEVGHEEDIEDVQNVSVLTSTVLDDIAQLQEQTHEKKVEKELLPKLMPRCFCRSTHSPPVISKKRKKKGVDMDS